MAINWSLAGNANPFADFAEGLEGGMQMHRQRQRDNLFQQQHALKVAEAQRAQAKEERQERRQMAVGEAVGKGDFATARTAAGGDFDLLKAIAELDDRQKKQVSENAELAARQLYTLRGLPPQEAAQRWEMIKPGLVARGLKAEELAIDFTQPGIIDSEIAEAMSLKEMVEQANKERDDKRADEKAKADEAYRAKMLAQGDRRIGLQADANRRGWASFNERKKAGGFGTPGVGGAVIPDDDVEID